MDFGWYGESDAAAAVDFLVRQPTVGRIGLVGLSMGGESAIGAAGVDPRVRAVVAEGATHRVPADKEYLVEEHGVRGEVQQRIDAVTYGVAGLLTDAPEPRPLRDSLLATSDDGTDTPVLLVAAGELETEQAAVAYLASASPTTVETWTVPGAGHTRGLDVAPDDWTRKVTGFLDDALVPSPGRSSR